MENRYNTHTLLTRGTNKVYLDPLHSISYNTVLMGQQKNKHVGVRGNIESIQSECINQITVYHI